MPWSITSEKTDSPRKRKIELIQPERSSPLHFDSMPSQNLQIPLSLFSCETQILLLSSHFKLSSAQTHLFHQLFLQSPLDWNRLEQVARLHRLLPLLYWQLQQPQHCHLLQVVPPDWWMRLQMAVALWTSHTAVLMQALAEWDMEARKHSIVYAVYKGPSCAYLLYPDPVVRIFNDLDILVSRSSLSAVDVLLKRLGYSIVQQQDWFRKKFYNSRHIRYRRKEVFLEIHWLISDPPLGLDTNLLLQHTHLVWMQDRQYSVLDAPEALLTLAIHGARHTWSTLLWITDVAGWLHKFNASDWLRAIQLAKQFHCTRVLNLAVSLAHHLLHAPIKNKDELVEKQDEAIQSTDTPVLADDEPTGNSDDGSKKAKDVLITNDLAVKSSQTARHVQHVLHFGFGKPLNPWAKHKLEWELLEQQKDRLIYLLRMLKPTISEYDCIHLSEYAAWLYYPIRWFRVLGKCCIQVWRNIGR